MLLDPENFMDVRVLYGGYYQREVLDAVLSALPENGVFWDVGANIGLHSVTVKALRPDVEVVAIEPAPLPAIRVLQNARLNGVQVRLAGFALGGCAGYENLSLVIEGNSGLSSFRPWSDVRYGAHMLTRCERADDLIASGMLPAPDVVKIDVEGYELEVLRGMPALLASGNLKAVIFEAHDDPMRPNDPFSSLFGAAGLMIEPLPPRVPDEPLINYVARRTGSGRTD